MTFQGHGKRKIRRYPYISPRFRCTLCHVTFTASYFSLQYRDRQRDTYEEIETLRRKGDSKRGVARFLSHSVDTVNRRIAKMARQDLLRLALDTQRLSIKESIAYDGIENFAFSQYDPNNVNHAIGRESLFVYDFNFCPLNRKGRKTEAQKKKKDFLEGRHGRYPGRAIEHSSSRIFQRMFERAPALVLHTDDHYMYRDALKRIGIAKRVDHQITSSKKGRNYRNKLFAVNHLDMLTRHHLCDFKRETIAFAKTTIGMLESFVTYVAHKNYRRPMFTKKQRSDARAHMESPAMRVGLTKRVLSFREYYGTRITKEQVRLNEDWLKIFERRDAYSRRAIRVYSGI